MKIAVNGADKGEVSSAAMVSYNELVLAAFEQPPTVLEAHTHGDEQAKDEDFMLFARTRARAATVCCTSKWTSASRKPAKGPGEPGSGPVS